MPHRKEEIIPPEFQPEPGWQLLKFPRKFSVGRSFVSGDIDGDRLRIWYFLRDEDAMLCAKVWFGIGAEGPPGHAHGGSMAAVLDEAMGFASWVAGHPVVAATITVNFRHKLPLETVFRVEAWVEQVENKKVITKGRIFDPETERVFSDAEGIFIKQPIEKFGNMPAMPAEGEKARAARP